LAVYLFTFHAYGTWLPDRQRGYTRRDDGVHPKDDWIANCYREAMSDEPASMTKMVQQVVVDAVREKCEIKDWTCHGIATDLSHVHILLSWEAYTPWESVRRGLKSSITRQLNVRIARRKWLTQKGSRKWVKARNHFDYLLTTYLPSHSGVGWYRHLDKEC